MSLPVQQSNIAGREYIEIDTALNLIRDTAAPDGKQFTIVLEGQAVPGLTLSQSDTGEWFASLDQRLGFPLGTLDAWQLNQIVRLVANSMAFAAGFSCFGEGSRVLNPYRAYPPPTSAGAQE